MGIKSIEHAIIDKAWEEGWVGTAGARAQDRQDRGRGRLGPAGLAAAQQLARAGHAVTVFEKNDRIGGLLRYGIPDFKMEKSLIDRRIEQMQAEGVTFRPGVMVTEGELPGRHQELRPRNDVRPGADGPVRRRGAGGRLEVPRDLPVPGRELAGVHYALEFLIPQNKEVAGDAP